MLMEQHSDKHESHDPQDLIFPSETIGKRFHVELDSCWLIKVLLDKEQQKQYRT